MAAAAQPAYILGVPFTYNNPAVLRGNQDTVFDSTLHSTADVTLEYPNLVLLGKVHTLGKLIIKAERCFIGGDVKADSISFTGQMYYLNGPQQAVALGTLKSMGIFLQSNGQGGFTYKPSQNAS